MGALLEVRGLSRSFYGVSALRGVELSAEPGRITGLIGPNGAGKTTLFNCISGVVPPHEGTVTFDGRDITGWRPDRVTRAGLVRTFQIARGFPQLTVLENMLLYGRGQVGERVGAALFGGRTVARQEAALRDEAFAVARRLNLTHVLNNPASDLSGGQKKLLEIGRALMARPKMILLDEPVAGVNPTLAKEIEGRLRTLADEGLSVLLIEHRMDTVAQLCDRVFVFAEGTNLAEGSFAEVARDERVQEAYIGPAAMGSLSVAGLTVGYGPSDQILHGVDFALGDGEIVGVIGPNGAGKSTLFKAIAGLLRPSAGTIALNGDAIAGHAPRDICRLGLAYVPQEDNIFPSLSVRENLEMGGFAEPKATSRRIEAVFTRFGALAEKRRRAARTLSGGERQMLAMAMALMVDPSVLLLDEPSAGLSPAAAERLFDSIVSINREGVAIAMVEQNAREALEIATRAYILVDGRNSRDGPAPELAADPDIRRLFLGT